MARFFDPEVGVDGLAGDGDGSESHLRKRSLCSLTLLRPPQPPHIHMMATARTPNPETTVLIPKKLTRTPWQAVRNRNVPPVGLQLTADRQCVAPARG